MAMQMLYIEHIMPSLELEAMGNDGIDRWKEVVKNELAAQIPLDEIGSIREEVIELPNYFVDGADRPVDSAIKVRYIWEPLSPGAIDILTRYHKGQIIGRILDA